MVLALVLVLTACGDRAVPLAAASASPAATGAATPTAAPSPSASASPTHLPGSSVRVTVNGADLQQGQFLPDDQPAVVVLTFPVAIDRASVATWLPRDIPSVWSDDRTLTLTFPATAPNPAFKIPQALSQDGSTVIDLVVVNLMHRPSASVSIFTLAELLGGARAPKPDATHIGASRREGLVPSPDGTKILVPSYSALNLSGARIIDLATRAVTSVAVPVPSAPATHLGWAGNGRVVFLQASHVWVSALGGSAAADVADLSSIGTVITAAISPKGTSIAVGSRDQLRVIDLASGAMRALTGHRYGCDQALVFSSRLIAWSPDERRIAAVECGAAAPTITRTRFIDIAGDRTVATVDGGGPWGISALLTGDLAVGRDPGFSGEGAPTLWVVFSFDGVERTHFLSRSPALSPDGRYVLESSCCAGGPAFGLIDLQDPNAQLPSVMGMGQWLRDGRILVVTY